MTTTKKQSRGRPKGAINRRTLEDIERLRKGGLLPLDYMLRIMRAKPQSTTDTPEMIERRDRMAIAAAPFLHAKLTAVSVEKVPNVDLSKLSDDELQRAIELRRELERLLAGRDGNRVASPAVRTANGNGSTRH